MLTTNTPSTINPNFKFYIVRLESHEVNYCHPRAISLKLGAEKILGTSGPGSGDEGNILLGTNACPLPAYRAFFWWHFWWHFGFGFGAYPCAMMPSPESWKATVGERFCAIVRYGAFRCWLAWNGF